MKPDRDYLSERDYKLIKVYTEEFDMMEELDNLVSMDLSSSSPELCEYVESPHDTSLKCVSEKGGLITRYYEDERYARSYCVCTYNSGVVIVFDKETGLYGTFVLIEDDGGWSITRTDVGAGFSRFKHKNDFITTLSEALSIFNSNYDEKRR